MFFNKKYNKSFLTYIIITILTQTYDIHAYVMYLWTHIRAEKYKRQRISRTQPISTFTQSMIMFY